MIHPHLRFVSRKALTASLIATATLSLATVTSAQLPTAYSEDFSSGYQYGSSLSDQKGWTTNDEYTGGQYTYTPSGSSSSQTGYIGQSDEVEQVVGTSNTPFNNDFVGYLGGLPGSPQTAPGTSTPFLTQSLPTGSYGIVNFSTDFLISQSTFTGHTAHDSFSITLTGASGSLITINFVVPTNSSATSDNVTYTASGTTSTPAGPSNTPLNQRYRLSINANVTMGTFGATIQGENANGSLIANDTIVVATGATYGVSGNAGLANAITGYGITWALANNNPLANTTPANNPGSSGSNNVAYTGFGSNGLFFTNVLVTVPEPSTYALIGLGVLGMAIFVRRSRQVRSA